MAEQKQYKKLEASEGTFKQPQKNEPKFKRENVQERVTVAYAYDGHNQEKTIDEKSPFAFAKVIHINGRPKYFVKVCKLGNNEGMLPNPKSIAYTHNETAAKIGGAPMYDWFSVKKELFDEYMKFLKTGEQRWVRAAQNRLRN